MKRKNKQEEVQTINQLVLRVMNLMDENAELQRHMTGIDNQIFNIMQSVASNLNSIGKSIQECQNKQMELEKLILKHSEALKGQELAQPKIN